MTPEEIALYASAIQNIAVTLAVVIGGGWTLYTFIQLRTIDKAKAELRKLQHEQAVVAINVDAKQLDRYDGDGYVISGVAVISNKGNRNTRIDFSADDSCTITKVIFSESGQPTNGDSIYSSFYIAYYLRTGAEIKLPFIVLVSSPGIYKVCVKSPLYKPEAQQAESIGGDGKEFFWEGVSFVAVSDIPKTTNTLPQGQVAY